MNKRWVTLKNGWKVLISGTFPDITFHWVPEEATWLGGLGKKQGVFYTILIPEDVKDL